MIPSLTAPDDPAALAASVRALARRAHRALNDPAAGATEVEALARRAARLRAAVVRRDAGQAHGPLGGWLGAVQARLEQRPSGPRSEG